jgi:large subunit ribosomal protein L1
MTFKESFEEAVENSEDRNFTESIDLIINFRDIDLSDPNNRFNEDFKLPYQADDEVKIAVIGESIVNNADNADRTITKDELEEMYDNPDQARKLADEFSFLIAEAPMMPKIGQQLGQIFGPRNMMPDPMPPGSDPTDKIESLRNTVTLRLREDPLMQVKVGNEEQDDDEVASNAEAIYDFVVEQLPQGDNNIKSVLLKTTMGSPAEVNN